MRIPDDVAETTTEGFEQIRSASARLAKGLSAAPPDLVAVEGALRLMVAGAASVRRGVEAQFAKCALRVVRSSDVDDAQLLAMVRMCASAVDVPLIVEKSSSMVDTIEAQAGTDGLLATVGHDSGLVRARWSPAGLAGVVDVDALAGAAPERPADDPSLAPADGLRTIAGVLHARLLTSLGIAG
jgi:hypothetical protein